MVGIVHWVPLFSASGKTMCLGRVITRSPSYLFRRAVAFFGSQRKGGSVGTTRALFCHESTSLNPIIWILYLFTGCVNGPLP